MNGTSLRSGLSAPTPPWNSTLTFLLGDPVRPLADHAVEAFADAVDLAALHGQEYVG